MTTNTRNDGDPRGIESKNRSSGGGALTMMSTLDRNGARMPADRLPEPGPLADGWREVADTTLIWINDKGL
jgi:hypothetical protein